MRALILAGLLLFTLMPASPAGAHIEADWVLLEPGLSVRVVVRGDQDEEWRTFVYGSSAIVMAGGGLLGYAEISPGLYEFRRLAPTGDIEPLFRVPHVSLNGTDRIDLDWVYSIPETGSVWIYSEGPTGGEIWAIEGLPRIRSAGDCPGPPGDLAPGTFDPATEPPTWTPTGDGTINVGDVVALMRASVGLQQIDCSP